MGLPTQKRMLSFRWTPELVAKIDAVRGDVPRTVWVLRAIEAALDVAPTPHPRGKPRRKQSAEPSFKPGPRQE